MSQRESCITKPPFLLMIWGWPRPTAVCGQREERENRNPCRQSNRDTILRIAPVTTKVDRIAGTLKKTPVDIQLHCYADGAGPPA